MIKLYNTLTKKKEEFTPIKKNKVGLYTCGPTVYWYAHIGNLRAYLFEDILKRVLKYNKHKVKHVMNITDVGHLTSDSDTGEDKLEKGAKKEKKTVWDIAEFYTKAFKQDLERLNIEEPNIWIKATDTIKEQIDLIKILEKKGYTYITNDGVYFNTARLKNYGRLWGAKERREKKARIEENEEKLSPNDFALWKFSPKNEKRQMEWKSPWGIGFPGWHTECVVMGIKELGVPFDIHCGGIDHIFIHHTNEIAQAEAAYNKLLANVWMHGEFLVLKDIKMSKSKNNILTLSLIDPPLAYRYLCLTAHYRQKLNFSEDAIQGAKNSLNSLKEKINSLTNESKNPSLKKDYENKFIENINDDLNTPKALALAWKMLKDPKLGDKEKYALIQEFDKIFGLNLKKEKLSIPKEIVRLAEQREKHRKNKEWEESDKIRKEIEDKGYSIEDTQKGFIIKKED